MQAYLGTVILDIESYLITVIDYAFLPDKKNSHARL